MAIKNYKDSRHQLITADQVRRELAEQERREQEERERPIREAEQQLTTTHRKLFELEKAEVLAHRPDPGFVMPDFENRIMTVAKALKFVDAESARFVEDCPEYFASKRNKTTLLDYLWDQKIRIPDYDAFKLAFKRCQYFGLLEERPAPEPASEPIPVEEPEPVDTTQTEELVDGWDLVTGEPTKYDSAAIWRMSSLEYKRAFKLWLGKDGVDRTPTFRRSRYQ
jgi:hypothetical protein